MTKEFDLLKRKLSKHIDAEETIKEVLQAQLINFYEYHYVSLSLNFVMFKESVGNQIKAPEVKFFIDEISRMATLIFSHDASVDDAGYLAKRHEMAELKKQLKDTIKVLTAYSDYLKIVEYKKNRLEVYSTPCPDDEKMTKEILEYIYSINQHGVIKDKIQMIFAQLPSHMSTTKILSLVDDTVEQYKGASKKALTDFSHMFMETVNPEAVLGFGNKFEEVYNSCADVNSKVDLGVDLDRATMELGQLSAIISDLINFYLVVADVLDNLLGILISEKHMLENYSSNDDLEGLFSEIVKTTDENQLNDLLVKCEGKLEKSLDLINQYQTLVIDIFQEYTDYLNENMDSSIVGDFDLLEKMLSNSYFPDIYVGGDEQASYQDLANAKKQLGDYVEHVLKGASRGHKQAIIGNMWPMLALPFKSPQELSDVIFQTLSTTKNTNEKTAFWELFKQIRELEA